MDFKTKKIKQENPTWNVIKDIWHNVWEQMGRLRFPVRFVKQGILIVSIFFILYIAFAGYSFIRNLQFDFSIPNIINNIFGQDLKTDRFGKTNILLLGVGGGLHDGPDLTDSIMIASYDHAKKTVSLLSIPRDLYVKITPGFYDRINIVYDFLSRKIGKEESMIQFIDLIKQITGLETQYYAKINFQGFKEVVDILGGIDVDVPETLVDEQYPVEDANGMFIRNERFVVQKGLQHMDGETALRYARSRHSTSDFDRGTRQHLVMTAIKEKALKEHYLTDSTSLRRLYYAVSSNIETDITINEMIRGAMLMKDISSDHIISAGLNDDNTKIGGFLYTPDRSLTNGAAVLIPDGSTVNNFDYYANIRRFVDIVTGSQEVFLQKAKISIINGTKVTGLGKTLRDKLTRFGFTIQNVSNAKSKEKIDTTTITVTEVQRFQVTLDTLKTFIIGEVISQPISSAETSIQENGPDIEIVIGQDYARYIP